MEPPLPEKLIGIAKDPDAKATHPGSGLSKDKPRLACAYDRIAGEQAGWSLIELMVAMVLLIVVLGAMLEVLDVSNNVSADQGERSVALDEAQSGVARMEREVRQAYRMGAAVAADKIDVVAVSRGSQDPNGRRIVYDCSVASQKAPGLKACVRNEYPPPDPNVTTVPAPDPATLISSTVVIDRVQNGSTSDPIFTGSPSATSPTYVRVTVKVPSAGERKRLKSSVTFDDGLYLRNLAATP